jgi:hypothetical protein
MAPTPTVYDLYAIASEAKCDYRTVRAVIEGRRVLPAVKAAVDAAIVKLGLQPRTVKP